MNRYIAFSIAAVVCSCACADTAYIREEFKMTSDHAYTGILKMTSPDAAAFVRFKKDADNEPEMLEYYPGKTTQDFAMRSWGIKLPHIVIGAVQNRGFVSELRNPLFSTSAGMSSPINAALTSDALLYTAASSHKFTSAYFWTKPRHCMLQGSCGIDGTSWISAQYGISGTRHKYSAAVFCGTFAKPLPPAKKWQTLYPDFGETCQSVFPAVKVSYVNDFVSIYALGAGELRSGHCPEVMAKAKIECSLPYVRLYAGAYQSSTAMRDFTGEFPGRDFQLTAALRAGTKKYSAEITGIAAHKTENTIHAIPHIEWNSDITLTALPHKTKLVITGASSGSSSKNNLTLTTSGTIRRRSLFVTGDACTVAPRMQWKRDSGDVPFYVYTYGGTLGYTAELTPHVSVAVSCAAGVKNLKKMPYSYVSPEAAVEWEMKTKYTSTWISSGFTCEHKQYDDASKEQLLSWFIAAKLSQKGGSSRRRK